MSTNKPIKSGIGYGVHWTIKERHGDAWVAVKEFDNLVTDFGLTALASATSAQYTAPIFLVIETSQTTLAAPANSGTNSVQLVADPTIAGDTQLVLSVGLGAEEVVTFNAKSGTGPFTFTLTANLVNNHLLGDPAVREVTGADTMAAVLSEAQYDPTFDAGNRVPLTAAFSPGTGQNTVQFFLSGLTATNLFFAHVGLTDQRVIGSISSNLHNYAHLGYNHNNTNDLEIDVVFTLQRF